MKPTAVEIQNGMCACHNANTPRTSANGRAEQEQQEDPRSRWHHDYKTLARGGEIFRLTAPGDPVTGRQLHVARDVLRSLLHDGAEITVAHVRSDDDTALAASHG